MYVRLNVEITAVAGSWAGLLHHGDSNFLCRIWLCRAPARVADTAVIFQYKAWTFPCYDCVMRLLTGALTWMVRVDTPSVRIEQRPPGLPLEP